MVNIHPVNTQVDYVHALRRIDALMDVERGSEEGAELDVLVTLVEAYERKSFPVDAPDRRSEDSLRKLD